MFFTIVVILIVFLSIDGNKKSIAASSSLNNDSDIVGLVKIDNVLKEYVLQTDDNSFYLNHDINKNENIGGSIFLDYRIDDDNLNKLIIYGHNSEEISLPFGALENYMEYDYYLKHQYIDLDIFNRRLKYQIFSVYVETTDLYYTRLVFNGDREWGNHLNRLKNSSIYDTGVNIDINDSILILQTCSKNKKYQKYDKKYLLIIGKLVY